MIALLVNKRSGSGVDADDLARRMRAAGAEVQAFDREERDAAAEAKPERIAVAGGDGSVGPAAELAGRLGVPLAVIPAGTANNFAAAAKLPTSLEGACRLAALGRRTRPMELGRAGDIPFVNLASAGLAPVAGDRAARWKRALGPAAYSAGAAAAALTTPPLECEIFAGAQREFAGSAWQVMLATTGAFGAGVRVEGTSPEDGALDLVVFPAERRTRLLRRGWWMTQGRVATQPGNVRARGPSFELRVAPGTRYNVDGEVLELGPTTFTVEARAFQLVFG